MEKVTNWDYAMTGDEYELVSGWAKNAHMTMNSLFYDNWNDEIYEDEDFKKLRTIRDRIFKEKTKTKDEWEKEIDFLQDSLIRKYNLKRKM